MALTEGNHIAFTYQGRKLEGLVIQVKEGNATVKLGSGYNMIVPEKDIEDVKTIQTEEREAAPPRIKQDSSLPRVTILHTGGTIASKVDYETGGVDAQFEPEELIAMFPDLLRNANITSRLLGNMWSEDMRFAHYNIMARAALEEIGKGATGIIVTHGTDMLHYSAAALSFALENVSVPVMIVGAQRSSDRGSSDAAANLLGAVTFITEAKLPGVFVAMHENASDDCIAIIEGVHVRKNHSTRRDAFVSVNAPQFARVRGGSVEILDTGRSETLAAQKHAKTRVMPFREDLRVGLWKAHPQSFVDELKPYDSVDGLLVEASGMGQLPISGIDGHTKKEHPYIREKIQKLAKSIPVAIATQAIFGRVNLNVYAPGRKLKEMGVLGDGCDMHPECAFVKLAWLLSNHPEDVRELYGKNLRGELTERSPLESGHKPR